MVAKNKHGWWTGNKVLINIGLIYIYIYTCLLDGNVHLGEASLNVVDVAIGLT